MKRKQKQRSSKSNKIINEAVERVAGLFITLAQEVRKEVKKKNNRKNQMC